MKRIWIGARTAGQIQWMLGLSSGMAMWALGVCAVREWITVGLLLAVLQFVLLWASKRFLPDEAGTVKLLRLKAGRQKSLRQKIAKRLLKDRAHDEPPPFTLGGVAIRVGSVFRLADPAEGRAKPSFHDRGLDALAKGCRGAGIDFGHGFGGLDQGAGGVEEKGVEHRPKGEAPQADFIGDFTSCA